jgi:alpha-glucosidase (family GH31 glycosyl hydrolase)
MLTCTMGASLPVLFRCRIGSAAILPDAAGTAAPEELDLTLTAMSAQTLRIGIAPANDIAPNRELGFVANHWPAPLAAPGPARPATISWGKYTISVSIDPLCIAVLQDGKRLQEIRFDPGSTDIHFLVDGPVFGLGEGAHPLDRRGTQEGLLNGQQTPDLRVFGARVQIPWIFSPAGWGIFIGLPQGGFEFTQQEGSYRGPQATSTRNIFCMFGDGPVNVLKEYARLTGFPHLPPRWALGYMQSHRTLASRDEVFEVMRTFREKKLPCDAVIYLGTGFCPSGWNTGHGSFTFNDQIFPDPAADLKQIHEQNFKVILHVVPPADFHGKITDSGEAAAEPGDAAAYWQQHAALDRLGVDGWWPDEGDQLPVSARLARNQMYFEGSRKVNPNVRPFALHRNGYAGIQGYGWLWSGDTSSTWRTLRAQIMGGIGAGLSGIPFWGTDIGGFVPTEELTPELYVRWFQWSAFCPLFRGHGRAWKLRLPWGWNTGTPGPKEVSGEWTANWPPEADLHRADVEAICRKYLNLRYQLLPYIYSTAAQAHETGLPLIRALSIGWPQDPQSVLIDDAYMWGDHFLVAPVYEPQTANRQVYLPQGTWWDYWKKTGIEGGKPVAREVDLGTIPLFVKAGAIVPVGPVRQYAEEPSTEPVSLMVYPGADGRFTWYDDDGSSFRYESGEFMRVECEWHDRDRTLTLAPDPSGRQRLPETIRVLLFDGSKSRIIKPTRGVLSVAL